MTSTSEFTTCFSHPFFSMEQKHGLLTAYDLKPIEAFHITFLQSILGIYWYKQRTKKTALSSSGLPPLLGERISSHYLSLFRHTICLGDKVPANRIFHYNHYHINAASSTQQGVPVAGIEKDGQINFDMTQAFLLPPSSNNKSSHKIMAEMQCYCPSWLLATDEDDDDEKHH